MNTYSRTRNRPGPPRRAWGRRRIILVAGLAVALGVALVGTLSVASARADDAANSLAADKSARLQKQIDAVRNQPARRKPSDAEARSAAAAANAGGAPAQTAGIVDMRQGPFPAIEFAVRNMYRAPVGDRWLYAFAGAMRDETGQQRQGALRVYQQTADGAYTFIGLYPAPSNGGALTATFGSGPVVGLTNEVGQSLTFNLATLNYGT